MLMRYQLPRMIERGVANVLDARFYDDAGAEQTPSATSTVTVYRGSVEVDSEIFAVITLPASITIAAVDTADLSLSEDWLEVWEMLIGGTVYTFRRPGYLVRHVLYPVITDTDLTDLHSDLADLIDPDQSTYEAQRVAAWNRVQKWLIRKGNRPQLVLDSWALADLHTYETLAAIFVDFALSTGTGADRRYRELADHYTALCKEQRDTIVMRYDADEDGFVGDEEIKAATGVLYLSHPPEY